MAVHMLTTVDNPYDPFTQFDEWLQFDQSSGYFTIQYQARLTLTSHNLSEADESAAIENAIDEIVNENVNGMYRKVEAPVGWEEKQKVLS